MKTALTTFACLLLCIAGTHAATYHFDSADGDDSAAGTSPDQAWKSLGKAAGIALKPGDSLLFRAGGRWSGQLKLKGGGTPEAPLKIAGYGEGSRPRIDAEGKFPAAVFLENTECIEIRGLELTNLGPGRKSGRFGIQIDIPTSVPARFHDLRIEGCHIKDCSRSGKAPVNTLIRENTFVLAPGQKGTFSFGIAMNVRIEGNHFLGEIAPPAASAQVKLRDNLFQPGAPAAVKISGTAAL